MDSNGLTELKRFNFGLEEEDNLLEVGGGGRKLGRFDELAVGTGGGARDRQTSGVGEFNSSRANESGKRALEKRVYKK